MKRSVWVPQQPQRIISLVPSQTELLFDLGLRQEVVGITKFCIHPQEFFKITPKVGGTKKFRFDVIESLQPDLIIANKEENYAEGIYKLAEKYPVWVSDIANLQEALIMIRTVGQMVGKALIAQNMANNLVVQFAQSLPKKPLGLKVAYFIWRKPYMSIGQDTFIHHILERCGLENVFAHQSRYPEISKETLQAAQPDLIFLSSEPFPFKEAHMAEFQEICPSAQVHIVDGEMFSWYGSRLRLALPYLKALIKKILP